MLYTLFLMMVDFFIAETGHGCWIPHFEWGHLVHSTYSSAVEGYVDQKQKPLAGTEAFGWDDVVVLTSTVAIGFSLGVWKWDKSMNIHESYLIPSGKLVNIQKTMEHHHFSWVNPLFLPFSMSLFVCLPEGSFSIRTKLVGGDLTILKNDGVRQWEGWHPIYDMENRKGSKPPTRKVLQLVFINTYHVWHLSV